MNRLVIYIDFSAFDPRRRCTLQPRNKNEGGKGRRVKKVGEDRRRTAAEK